MSRPARFARGARLILVLAVVVALLAACVGVDDSCACSYGEKSDGKRRDQRVERDRG